MQTKLFLYKEHKIPYVDEGKGEPLILLHGWGVSPAIYQNTIYELGKYYRVIAPYLHGSKEEDKIDRVVGLLDSIGVNKVLLVAHSSAGILAITLAYHLPNRIRALILVGTLGVGSNSGKKMFLNWLSHTKGMLFGKQKEEKPFLGRLAADFAEQIIRFPFFFLKETRYIIKQDVSALFQSLTVPILLVWGRDDKLVPVSVGEAMVKLNKKAELKVIAGGHNWVKVNPAALIECIKGLAE